MVPFGFSPYSYLPSGFGKKDGKGGENSLAA